jgi:hypothetical protein
MLFTVNKGIIPASLVEVGDELLDADSNPVLVDKLSMVTGKGAFAPFTSSGKLIVDDVTVSSYVSLQDSSTLTIGNAVKTPFSFHWVAHSFNAPHRFYCRHMSQCLSEKYTDEGLSEWVATPYRITVWIFSQNSAISTMLMILILPILFVFWLSESLPFAMIAIGVGFLFVARERKRKTHPASKTL